MKVGDVRVALLHADGKKKFALTHAHIANSKKSILEKHVPHMEKAQWMVCIAEQQSAVSGHSSECMARTMSILKGTWEIARRRSMEKSAKRGESEKKKE